MSTYYVGLDLGQLSDYTALVVVQAVDVAAGERAVTEDVFVGRRWVPGRGRVHEFQKVERQEALTERHYHVRHAQRFEQRTPYPKIVDAVKGLLARPPLAGDVSLVVDATGVGVAVVDTFKERDVFPAAEVTITGGDQVHQDGDRYRVPKRELVGVLQVVFQNDRLKIPRRLELGSLLTAELQNFRAKINLRTGHDSYEAGGGAEWREGQHDDLVLALALACWFPEHAGDHWLF